MVKVRVFVLSAKSACRGLFPRFSAPLPPLLQVTLRHQEERVRKVEIKYFDTVPVANALVVLRAGFLFAASEFSNHRLYQFQGIGDDEDDSIIGYPILNPGILSPIPDCFIAPPPFIMMGHLPTFNGMVHIQDKVTNTFSQYPKRSEHCPTLRPNSVHLEARKYAHNTYRFKSIYVRI